MFFMIIDQIQIHDIPLGKYTLVFELFHPKSINQICIQSTSSVATVSNIFTNSFDDHTRSLINFQNNSNNTPNLLDINFRAFIKETIVNSLDAYIIFYGVKNFQKKVDVSIWDKAYYVKNSQVYYKAPINMDNHEIKGLEDGVENNDAVNVKQLNEVESNAGNYVNSEIAKVNSNINSNINNLRNFFLDEQNKLLVEYSLSRFLITLFHVNANEHENSNFVSRWKDKKRSPPFPDADQNDDKREPSYDNDLNSSYILFNPNHWLTVDYNLNGKDYLNIFIVFRIFDTNMALNGIFGNENGGYDLYIAIVQNERPWKLKIGFGNGSMTIYNFPNKADPTTLNFSVLSFHYNTANNFDSKVFCYGKSIQTFIKRNSNGENTFSIGSIRSNPENTGGKEIAYFSLYHTRLNEIDIKRIHYYLCQRYKIDHDAIDIS